MSKCTLCPLYKESRINLIQGTGPQPAKILFIGEGPGEDEEKTGRPFTGPAGQLFDQLLTQAGIDRQAVRVTNIVRCRPVDKTVARTDRRGNVHYGNRPPTPEECYICAPTYLEKEIEETKPTVIVPLGNTALHYIGGEYQIHSNVRTYDKVKAEMQSQFDALVDAAAKTEDPAVREVTDKKIGELTRSLQCLVDEGTFTPMLTKQVAKIAKITSEAGIERWNDKYKCKVIPLIHPSALLRGGRQMNSTVLALQRIKIASQSIEIAPKKKTEYVLVDTWDMALWVLERLREATKFSYDVESTGLDWMRDSVFCLGFSWKIGTGVSVRWLAEDGSEIWTPEQKAYFVSELNKIFEDPTKTVVLFNAKFDLHMSLSKAEVKSNLLKLVPDEEKLRTMLGRKYDLIETLTLSFPKNIKDVMLMHHLLDSESAHGLKDLAYTYTDMGGYEDELDKDFEGQKKAEKNFLKVPRDRMATYNAADCDCTLRLEEIFTEMMKKYPKMEEFFSKWIPEYIKTILMIERAGAPIDYDRMSEMHFKMTQRCNDIESAFRTEAGVPDFNLNSPKQLQGLFFGQQKMKPTKMGKNGPSLDEEVINALSKLHPENKLLQNIVEYRSLKKSMATYLLGIKNGALFGRSFVSEETEEKCWTPLQALSFGIITDGRVHCDYLLHGTATGRLSAKNPPLQTIPRVTDEDIQRGFVIKSSFRADHGHVLLAADLSSAELWTLQGLSKDVFLRDALLSPEGVHLRFASRLFNKPWQDIKGEEKAIAKMVVFGIVYGRQGGSIAEQFKVSKEVGEGYVNGFLNMFPAAAYTMQTIVETARRDKKLMTVFGRIRHFPSIDSPNFLTRIDAEHQAVNFPMSSTASDITQIAGCKVRWEIEKRGLKSRPIMTTHDDNTYHVPMDEVELMTQLVTDCMEAYVPELGIPMKAKVKVQDRLSQEDEEKYIAAQEAKAGEGERHHGK